MTGNERFARRRSIKRGRAKISGAGRGGKSFVRRKNASEAGVAGELAGMSASALERFCLAIEFPSSDGFRIVRSVA